MVSFLAEKNFLGSMIRGKQIADYIGGQYNPKCIYIKPTSLNHIRDCDYVDVSDGEWEHFKTRPKLKLIANSLYGYEFLKEHLPNEIIYIPQQHLNWERTKRDRKGITCCGYIGKHSKVADKMYKEIADKLTSVNLQFEFFSGFFTREDAIEFYKRIDLLIVGPWKGDGPFKTPTKLINAASFGVPSIAYPIPQYKEFEGYYIPYEDNLLGLINKLDYDNFAQKIMVKAEDYHISKIAELYKKL